MDSVFIIGEAGVNHNGRMDLARTMIEHAADAGVDAVKFQAFNTEKLVSTKAEKAGYQKKQGKTCESQSAMLKKLELNANQLQELKHHCKKNDVDFLATPFDSESLRVVNELAEVIKIGSGEVTNLPFLKEIARTGKPAILSTGMSSLSEVDEAVRTIGANQSVDKHWDFPPLTLLHCTSSYPCDFEHVNLRAMETLKESFKLPVGFSDHTLGTEVPIAATALGATVIEKHFTLDCDMEGPDHQASVEPDELSKLVQSVKNVSKALGDGYKQPQPPESSVQDLARKSLIASTSIDKNTTLQKKHISVKRPGNGIAPKHLEKITGLELKKAKEKDQAFRWTDFKENT